METKTNKMQTTDVSTVCPDYDADCKTMSLNKATWCFMGCQEHPCNPNISLGTAKGICPIIHNIN